MAEIGSQPVFDPLGSIGSLTLALGLGLALRRAPSQRLPGLAASMAAELARRGELDAMLAGLSPDVARDVATALGLDRSMARYPTKQTKVGQDGSTAV